MIRFRALLIPVALVAVGCQPPPKKSAGVEGQRDDNAVAVRLHNRTNVELVIQTFVRRGQTSVPMTNTVRLASTEQKGPFEISPDIEVPLFKALPIDPAFIGGYSIEVVSDKLEARLATLDLTAREMAEAKAEGKFIIVFRDNGLSVLVGKKHWSQPWMREIPHPKTVNTPIVPDADSETVSKAEN